MCTVISDFWRCYWQVDMHTYQCFGPFWNAVHNDDAGKDLHYLVSCAYAYQVGERFLWSLFTLVGSRTIPLDIFWRMESWECWPLGLEWPHLRMVHFMSSVFFSQKYKIWTPRSASHPDFTGGVPQVVGARTNGCLRKHWEGSWMVFLER